MGLSLVGFGFDKFCWVSWVRVGYVELGCLRLSFVELSLDDKF